MKNLVVVLSIFLASCSLFPFKNNDAIITHKVVKIDPRALQPCEDLILVQEESFESILAALVSNSELYLDCRNKQDNSIKLLKEFSNTK